MPIKMKTVLQILCIILCLAPFLLQACDFSGTRHDGDNRSGDDGDDDDEPCTDQDNDDWCSTEDCNDFNSGINPGAVEDCFDQVDNDCDYFTDAEDPDCDFTDGGDQTS